MNKGREKRTGKLLRSKIGPFQRSPPPLLLHASSRLSMLLLLRCNAALQEKINVGLSLCSLCADSSVQRLRITCDTSGYHISVRLLTPWATLGEMEKWIDRRTRIHFSFLHTLYTCLRRHTAAIIRIYYRCASCTFPRFPWTQSAYAYFSMRAPVLDCKEAARFFANTCSLK